MIIFLYQSNEIIAQQDNGIFENFVEGYVKDIFNKELTTAKNNNLTDCMTRLLCENICRRTVNGEIKTGPLTSTARILGQNENDPIGYLFTGGDRGFEFGQQNQCHQCASQYSNCQTNQYDYTRSISDQYEQDMLKDLGTG